MDMRTAGPLCSSANGVVTGLESWLMAVRGDAGENGFKEAFVFVF